MKRFAIVILTACTLASFATASSAQSTSGPYIPPRASNPDTFQESFDNRALMGDPTAAAGLHGRLEMVAKCLARRATDAGKLVGGVLAGDPNYKQMEGALSRRYAVCAKDDPHVPSMLVSGVLAEQLVLGSSATFDDRAKAVDVDKGEKFFGGLTGAVSLDAITGCLAVYSPGLVHKVLITDAGSAEEAAALDALYANSPECGLPSQPAGIAAIYQRAALATALYEWTGKAT